MPQKGAFSWRLFVFARLALLARLVTALCLSPVQADTVPDICAIASSGEPARVEYVIDGDTVVLSDQRRVRLIGIDTPEISHDGKPSDPGAYQAREFLRDLLARNPSVVLVYDQERYDRYNRTLAHLFLPDAGNIQAMILNEGLATPLTMPPNLQFTDCYQQQAGLAIQRRQGLWSLPQYQPVAVAALDGTERGYHIITGKVTRVWENRGSIRIHLESRVTLRIQRADLPYFKGMDLYKLEGETVQARGWLTPRGKEPGMPLRHPADLQVSGTIPGN